MVVVWCRSVFPQRIVDEEKNHRTILLPGRQPSFQYAKNEGDSCIGLDPHTIPALDLENGVLGLPSWYGLEQK